MIPDQQHSHCHAGTRPVRVRLAVKKSLGFYFFQINVGDFADLLLIFNVKKTLQDIGVDC